MEIINEILKWPIIVQGALGSFLFWLVYVIMKLIISYTQNKVGDDKELGYFFIQNALSADEKASKTDNYTFSDLAVRSFLTAIYGGIHYFFKFIAVITFSFLVERLIPGFAYAGYLISIYFLFRAFSYMPHFTSLRKHKEKKQSKK